MEIVVNGSPRQVPDAATVGTLVTEFSLDPRRVAVERNRELVKRVDWEGCRLQPGDRLEIVELVGGGA